MITKDGLFSKYLMEKQGVSTYFTPSGFVSYKLNEDHIHIHEMFVEEEARNTGVGNALLGRVKDLAKENEYKFITCRCQIDLDGAESSLERIIGAGFKLLKEPKELNFVMEVS